LQAPDIRHPANVRHVCSTHCGLMRKTSLISILQNTSLLNTIVQQSDFVFPSQQEKKLKSTPKPSPLEEDIHESHTTPDFTSSDEIEEKREDLLFADMGGVPLYASAKMTLLEYFTAITSLILEGNMTDSVIEKLLKIFHLALPQPNNAFKSLYFLEKILKRQQLTSKTRFYCPTCSSEVRVCVSNNLSDCEYLKFVWKVWKRVEKPNKMRFIFCFRTAHQHHGGPGRNESHFRFKVPNGERESLRRFQSEQFQRSSCFNWVDFRRERQNQKFQKINSSNNWCC
jgi:hypothetical protein